MNMKIDPEARIRELSSLIERYQRAYYTTGHALVSDSEFDRLFDELLRLEQEFPALRLPDSPTYRVGSDLSSELPEAEHSIPVLSLDKAYSIAAVEEWMTRTALKSSRKLSFAVEEKIDGISIVLYYEEGVLTRALTRGNGYVGNDVTANVKTIKRVPLRLSRAVTIAVRGEIFLPVASFERLNSTMEIPYANPRNLAAGTIRRIKSSETARIPLDIFVYEGFFTAAEETPLSHSDMIKELEDLGLPVNPAMGLFVAEKEEQPSDSDVPESWQVGTFADVGRYIEAAAAARSSRGYEIDGLVIKVNELPVREILGYTGHHPRWEIAFKFESPEGVTRVLGIDVQVGRTGRITPVARVVPVKIGGSVVSNVTLHNQDYVDLLELAIGDEVAVSKRGDVIPAVERVLEKCDEATGTWHMPDSCPSCGSALVQSGAHTFCRNPDCPAQLLGRIQFFAAKGQMDIDNLGPETIQFLISEGLLHSIADLYRIDYLQLAGKPGFGEKKCRLLQEGVAESRGRPYDRVIVALGIPDLGRKAVELLIADGIRDIGSLLALADAGDTDRLTSIRGFGEKSAASIVRELQRPQLRSLIDELRALGLNFSAPEAETSETRLPQIFTGEVWCVTGSFEAFKPRSVAMEAVEQRGGRTVSAVTGKTTHLLAGSGAGSKLRKAAELGVKVVTEAEFLGMLE